MHAPKKVPSRPTRRLFALRLNQELVTDLRHIALDLKKPANQLHEEAIEDLIKKYRAKGKAS